MRKDLENGGGFFLCERWSESAESINSKTSHSSSAKPSINTAHQDRELFIARCLSPLLVYRKVTTRWCLNVQETVLGFTKNTKPNPKDRLWCLISPSQTRGHAGDGTVTVLKRKGMSSGTFFPKTPNPQGVKRPDTHRYRHALDPTAHLMKRVWRASSHASPSDLGLFGRKQTAPKTFCFYYQYLFLQETLLQLV